MTSNNLDYLLDLWPLSDGTEDHLSCHHLLLRDQVRNETFRRAIHQVVKPGDHVLDVGAGTGILSAFALQAGAKHVYLVESEDTISCARELLEHAGWSERVTLVRGKAESLQYIGGKVDTILIELIGSFGIDESILDILPPVRNDTLQKRGHVIPCRMRLLVAPIAHASLEKEMGLYRSTRHGVDLSPLTVFVDNNVCLANLRSPQFLAEPQQLIEFDLLTCQQSRFERRVNFPILESGRLIGIAGWFEVDLCEGVALSNHPMTNKTHWDQVVFPIGEPVPLQAGDSVSFRLHHDVSAAGDEWTWSGTIETQQERRRYNHSSENRFPVQRVRTRNTLRIG
ncbi:MAG: methyltransferase domain-containing protein [bacterium]